VRGRFCDRLDVPSLLLTSRPRNDPKGTEKQQFELAVVDIGGRSRTNGQSQNSPRALPAAAR